MENKMEIIQSNMPTEQKEIVDNKILMEIVDKRNPEILAKFDLEDFFKDLNTLMTFLKTEKPEKRFIENKIGNWDKYGKYFQEGTAEFDGLINCLRNAKAIRVTVENIKKIVIKNKFLIRTIVTIETIKDRETGERTKLNFDENGKYLSGSLTQTLKRKKVIKGGSNIIEADWKLVEEPEQD